MTDFSHLDALEARLARETARLASATKPADRAYRQREIDSCKREIAGELRFLGLEPFDASALTDDELLTELNATPKELDQ